MPAAHCPRCQRKPGAGGLACPEGLEPPTCCLEGSCSIQLSYGHSGRHGIGKGRKRMVGAAGFELATLCSQSRCATRLRYAPNAAQFTIVPKPTPAEDS